MAKIVGTWNRHEEKNNWRYTEQPEFVYNSVYDEILVIDNENVQKSSVRVIKKADDSAFTQEEKDNHWKELESEPVDDDDYKYNCKISADGKTITEEKFDKKSLSRYFQDEEYELFDNGTLLRTVIG